MNSACRCIWFMRPVLDCASLALALSCSESARYGYLDSYKTAWAMLQKLRRAKLRPERDRLNGIVEVDETYWGGVEAGAIGRRTEAKALIVVAAQEGGIVRICQDSLRKSLFLAGFPASYRRIGLFSISITSRCDVNHNGV
jgi:hypothetical protein